LQVSTFLSEINKAISYFIYTDNTLGILKTGPCRLVPDQGPLGGHGTLGFLMLMLNIESTIISKGIMLPALGFGIPGAGYTFSGEPLFNSPLILIGVWIAKCYLPQLIFVSFA